MPEQAREQSRVFRQSNHAVAYVARRKHLQLFAQSSRTPAVVRDSDYGRERFEPEAAAPLFADKLLQTRKRRGQTRPSADGDELQAALKAWLQILLAP